MSNYNGLHLSRIFGITFVEKIYVSPDRLLTSYIHSRSFDFCITKQHLQDIEKQRYSEKLRMNKHDFYILELTQIVIEQKLPSPVFLDYFSWDDHFSNI